jgi:hypothetical protein
VLVPPNSTNHKCSNAPYLEFEIWGIPAEEPTRKEQGPPSCASMLELQVLPRRDKG